MNSLSETSFETPDEANIGQKSDDDFLNTLIRGRIFLSSSSSARCYVRKRKMAEKQNKPPQFESENRAFEGSQDKPSDTATYERARRLANVALWTLHVQRRRLNSPEPEDEDFPLRDWSDFQFFIVALWRFRRAAELAGKVAAIKTTMRAELRTFDGAQPQLKTMRDVAEHIDDYSVDSGRNQKISRKTLEVSSSDGRTWNWLGFALDTEAAFLAAVKLFEELKACRSILSGK